jgi:hypothetical protein
MVVRKDIKHVHLAVYPPDGGVRIAVPEATSDDVVHAAIASRLPWIRRQQASFRRQERESRREMVNGETHWFDGWRYRLRIVETKRRQGVKLAGGQKMELLVRPGATAAQREAILDRWYRAQLKAQVPALLDKWVPLVGVERPDWRIRHMRTRWGTCRRESDRIWLNIELAKKPRRHLEYIVVHELLHLVVRRHSAEFTRRLDALLPHWRLMRDELGDLPLGHERWPD